MPWTASKSHTCAMATNLQDEKNTNPSRSKRRPTGAHPLQDLRTPAALLEAQRLKQILGCVEEQALFGSVFGSVIRFQVASLLTEYSILTVSDIATLTDTKIAFASYHVHRLREIGLVSVTHIGRDRFVRFRHEEAMHITQSFTALANSLARICNSRVNDENKASAGSL